MEDKYWQLACPVNLPMLQQAILKIGIDPLACWDVMIAAA
jgi:hypothetical protein